VKDDELAPSAQVLTLHTTHADRAFLSKLVMHNKQALSRFSSPFEAIQARLSACNAQFYVFVSSTYVCALERGKIWGFWGTWGIFTVAITSSSLASLWFDLFLGMVCVEMGLLFVFALGSFCFGSSFSLSLFLVDEERRLKWRNCQLDQHATFKGSF
jgi:hypothetical protein